MKTLREAAKIEYLGKFVNKPVAATATASNTASTPTPTVAASAAASSELPASTGLDAASLNKGLSGLK